ncbi:MAG: hypothetical protein ABIF40_03835 [archaeon]
MKAIFNLKNKGGKRGMQINKKVLVLLILFLVIILILGLVSNQTNVRSSDTTNSGKVQLYVNPQTSNNFETKNDAIKFEEVLNEN